MPGRLLFYLLPAVTMSLGWGLRGTIGGGPVGAMIPGAMVALALCHLLGWNRRAATVAAFGTMGVGLGGQMTYGQTIGFVVEPETVGWGLLGMTVKGAVWGLSGGLLVGLGFTESRYRRPEILVGLGLMLLGTAAGRMFVDAPKLLYLSNPVDKPREEIWVALTFGAIALLLYLLWLNRERVSTRFALLSMIGGGIGFGGGGLFMWLGRVLGDPYRSWPWWKVMEFHFGLWFGLALGIACYLARDALQSEGAGDLPSPQENASHGSLLGPVLAGILVAFGGIWFQFTIPYKAMFSVVTVCLIGLTAIVPAVAWHVALSMTALGFVRDCLYKVALSNGVELGSLAWILVLFLSLPIVLLVAGVVRIERMTPRLALLGLTAIATEFGLLKIVPRSPGADLHYFVPLVFVLEALLVTVLACAIHRPGEDASRE